jgi:hypothetical protein
LPFAQIRTIFSVLLEDVFSFVISLFSYRSAIMLCRALLSLLGALTINKSSLTVLVKPSNITTSETRHLHLEVGGERHLLPWLSYFIRLPQLVSINVCAPRYRCVYGNYDNSEHLAAHNTLLSSKHHINLLSSHNPRSLPNLALLNLFNPSPHLLPDLLCNLLHATSRIHHHKILFLLLPLSTLK